MSESKAPSAADAMKLLVDSAVKLVEFAGDGKSTLERACLVRAEFYVEAAALIAEELKVPHRKEALDDIRRQLLHVNLAARGNR